MAKKRTYNEDFGADYGTSEIYKQVDEAKSYLATMGFARDVPIYTGFYEGHGHWPKSTQKTKDLPRPVLNAIKMIIDSKHGNIIGTPVKLNFRADNDRKATDKFNKFADYQQKEMRQEAADDIAVLNALVKGTGVYHYYWNENVTGRKGNYEGGLEVEVIDPLNIYFSDPTLLDVQKQEWIIIEDRLPVERVRDMCDKKSKRRLIVADDLETDYDTEIENDGSKLVTYYLKYFRKKGEVYFQKATRNVVLHKPIAINPQESYENIKKIMDKLKEREELDGTHPDDLDVDEAIDTSPDSELESESKSEKKRYMAVYYPIEVLILEPRDKSIYGLSQVAPCIGAQKAINFFHAMTILNAQQMGAPKYVVKSGALRGQQISNDFSQYLIDYTPLGNKGIDIIKPEPFTSGGLQIAPNLMDQLRIVTNSSEIITGEMIGKDLSGVAIAQLQAQSQKPIQQLQKRFWRSKERIGKILEQFYKLYYEETEFSYEVSKEEQMLIEKQNKAYEGTPNYIPQEIFDRKTDVFNGEEYKDTSFSLVVEAGAGTQYSEIQSMNVLNSLFQSQSIDLETFVKLYPNSAMPFKAEMLDYLSIKKQEENTVLKQQVAEQQQQLEQLSGYIKQTEAANKELLRALKESQMVNQSMQKEYSDKINQANQFIQGLTTPAVSKPTQTV